MSAPVPYLFFAGTARAALTHYAEVFGAELELYTYADFSRTDGPAEAVAHGMLRGAVELFAADAVSGQPAMRIEGMLLSLLGAAPPEVLHRWFDRLAEGGTVEEPLIVRPWGASDGQVTDRHGVRWLLGYEPAATG